MLFILLGVAMLFFGIKWCLQSLRATDIAEFPLTDRVAQFQIEDNGLYAICILGGGYVKNSNGFGAKVVYSGSGKRVILTENWIKPRLYRNHTLGVEYLQFNINEPGNYTIEFKNIDKLIVKESMLKMKQLFESSLPVEQLGVLIKKTIPVEQKLFGIVFLVLGTGMIGWGILMA